MSLFKKNIIGSYSAQIVSVACNFICSVLAARMLGALGKGNLDLYTAFAAFVTLIIGLGLPSAVVYFLAARKIEKGKVIPLITVMTLAMLSGFVFLFFLAREMNLLSVFLPAFVLEDTLWALVLFMHLLLLMMNQYFNSILQAENRFISSGIVTVAGSVLLLLMYYLKYAAYVADAIVPVYWLIFSMLTVAALQYFFYLSIVFRVDKAYLRFRAFSIRDIRPLLWFAGIAYIANLVQFLNYRMDIWLINYFHQNKEMIGIYGQAVVLAQLVWHLPNAIHGVLYTFVSSDNETGLKVQKAARTSKWLLLYAVVAGVCGYFLSLWLVPLWFGPEFSEVPALIGILLFGIVPFCYGIGISAYFAGIRKVQINMYGSMIGLLFCAVFDLLLIPGYGMQGAAIASVISYISTTVYFYIVFSRQS